MKNKYFSLWILRPRQMWISPRCSWRSAGSSTNTLHTTTSRRQVSISHPKGASLLRLRGRAYSHIRHIFDRNNTKFTRYFSSKVFPKSWIPEQCVAAEVLDYNLKFFCKTIIIVKRAHQSKFVWFYLQRRQRQAPGSPFGFAQVQRRHENPG